MARALVKGDRVYIWCPGCHENHWVNTGPGGWTFDGNVERPTFSPSILVEWGNQPGDRRCHSFVRGGRIQFLNDCTHGLRGQTVDLPDIGEHFHG